MATGTDNTVQIPVDLLLEIMRDSDTFQKLIKSTNFTSWMLESPLIVMGMLKDKIVKAQLLNEDDDVWNRCLHCISSKPSPSVQTDAVTSCTPSFYTPPSSIPAADIETKSVKGDAKSRLSHGSVENSRMNISTTTDGGDAQIDIGTLSIRGGSLPQFQNPRNVTSLNATSEHGKAQNKVNSLVLGNSSTTYNDGYARVKNGVAIASSQIGQGIFFNEYPERNVCTYLKKSKKISVVPPDDNEGPVERQKPFRSVPALESQDTASCEVLGLDDEPELETGKCLVPEDDTSIRQKAEQEATIVAAVSSTKGNATFQCKKMDVEIEDSSQRLLALSESKEKDAMFNVDELSFKMKKPEQKTFHIDKVVGSMYIDSNMNSTFTNCNGTLNGVETTVGNSKEKITKMKTSSKGHSSKPSSGSK